jgi:imidazolonepropionase
VFRILAPNRKTERMSTVVITNIKGLAGIEEEERGLLRGKEMGRLPVLENAYLLLENDRILDFGTMEGPVPSADKDIDAGGAFVFPSWVDSHTHLVFSHSREGEFVDRIRGLSYQEIAARGGGILNSARKLQDRSEEELLDLALERLDEVQRKGTGAIEIKSGYGLTVESEIKMLRVIRSLKAQAEIPVKATFLGAHALPQAYREDREGYLKLMIDEMLPRVAGEELADYIDVFCEKIAFSVEEMDRLLEAGSKYGLKPKVHVNQFYALGGIAAAVKHGAVSVDHLEVVSEDDIRVLQGSDTVATLLPSAPFFLNDHYQPARKMIDAGLAVALATDYNPGSTPSGNMPFVISLACIKLRMTPEEAINAATLNGAYALELQDEVGSIRRGKKANLIITRPMPSVAYFPYAFGSDLIERVIFNGKI